MIKAVFSTVIINILQKVHVANLLRTGRHIFPWEPTVCPLHHCTGSHDGLCSNLGACAGSAGDTYLQCTGCWRRNLHFLPCSSHKWQFILKWYILTSNTFHKDHFQAAEISLFLEFGIHYLCKIFSCCLFLGKGGVILQPIGHLKENFHFCTSCSYSLQSYCSFVSFVATNIMKAGFMTSTAWTAFCNKSHFGTQDGGQSTEIAYQVFL